MRVGIGAEGVMEGWRGKSAGGMDGWVNEYTSLRTEVICSFT